MNALLPFLYVGLGSMLGGVSRYGMSLLTQNYAFMSIPFGTLISNVVGCLVIGLIAGIAASSTVLSTEMRLLLAPGFVVVSRPCHRLSMKSDSLFRIRSTFTPLPILSSRWQVLVWHLFWAYY